MQTPKMQTQKMQTQKLFGQLFHSFLSFLPFLFICLLAIFPVPVTHAEEIEGQMAWMVLASNTFVFNPRTLRWTAIDENGQVVRSGMGSGGRDYCPDIHRRCHTPTGTYTIHSKGGPGCASSRYPVGHGGAEMPYCMFFTQYYAIHGSYEVPNYNASHGCIRVQPSDAKWLSENFIRIGTTVIVKPY